MLDTWKFYLFVMPDKFLRAEQLLWKLDRDKSRTMKVRRLAMVPCLIRSFYLAMSDVVRYHICGIIAAIVDIGLKFGWESESRLGGKVLEEIDFWRENLRLLNRLR